MVVAALYLYCNILEESVVLVGPSSVRLRPESPISEQSCNNTMFIMNP